MGARLTQQQYRTVRQTFRFITTDSQGRFVDEDTSTDNLADKSRYRKRIQRYTRKNRPLPMQYSEDAEQIVKGGKSLLTHGDKFHFGCTGCGMCCRDYAATVVLDPYDLYNMRKKVSFNVDDPRVRYSLGMFHKSSLGDLEAALDDTGAHSRKGVIPIMFLNTIAHEDGANWCGFASVSHSADDSSTGVVATCSFGMAHMPFTCSLYPLGEISTDFNKRPGKERSAKMKELQEFVGNMSNFVDRESSEFLGAGKSYFSLDHRGCEGVYDTEKPRIPNDKESHGHLWKNLSSYLERNNIIERKVFSDWFRCLLAAVACKSIDRRILILHRRTCHPSLLSWNDLVERYFRVLRQIWFSSKLWEDWPNELHRIDNQTSEVLLLLDKVLCTQESNPVSTRALSDLSEAMNDIEQRCFEEICTEN